MYITINFDVLAYDTNKKESEKLLSVKCYENELCFFELFKPDGSLLVETSDHETLFSELKDIPNMTPKGYKICYQITKINLDCYSDIVKMFVNSGFPPDVSKDLADESISIFLSTPEVPEIDNIIDNFSDFYDLYINIIGLSRDTSLLYDFIEYDELIDHYSENKELYI